MLRLKRASAGSGKTYELAKTYIKLLLTFKPEGGRRIIGSRNHLHDSLKSIMAVTFTVKATAEMKQRIIEKLADLSRADSVSPSELEKIDYFKEFRDELNCDKFKIAEMARNALRVLLLHYSDFKVQTIDSFFQNILHTFAYEASLDDNFNMEIDTDYISTIGLDNTLDELSEKSAGAGNGSEILYWLRSMMNSWIGRNWNVFTRNDNEKQLYGNLIREAKNLEKETYQDIHEELVKYFHNLGDKPFYEVVEEVDKANTASWIALLQRRYDTAKNLKEELDNAGLQISQIYNRQGSKLAASLQPFDTEKKFNLPNTKVACGQKATGFSLSSKGMEALEANLKNPEKSAVIQQIDNAYSEWMEASNVLIDKYEEEGAVLRTWQAYKSMFPKLMVVLEIAKRKEEYLKNTNSLQISDTNQILSKIIDGEDTPFVFERMGSVLNHFLIDEFQDTSKMQWENLRPLLLNSDATDNDNLIIGDAKQSIYRFRNADYHLIQNIGHDRGFSKIVSYTTENEPEDQSMGSTNFRSLPRVVEMNNFIFKNIVALNTLKDPKKPIFNPDVQAIYDDCVQAIPKGTVEEAGKLGEGFVEMVFTNPLSEDEKEEYENIDEISLEESGYSELPYRIKILRERGYELKDIGILVKSHKQGFAAIKAINSFNALPENADNQILVISEENLLVASALSVQIVVHALRIIVDGFKDRYKDDPFLPLPVDEDELFELLHSLNSMSLPSVVEAIIEKFVPRTRRNSEAQFIAAFQDAVLEYSSSRNSDVASFLKWWKIKSKTLSITSSDEADGVKLQTIHKAKGLEFKVVIIPSANFVFDPRNMTEWRWEKPSDTILKYELLPPYIPLITDSRLIKTAHKEVREKYCEDFALDELNKMYVGFTRAVDELYVYLPVGKQPGDRKAGDLLQRLFESDEAVLKKMLPEDVEIDTSVPERVEIRYGKPLSPQQIEAQKKKEAEKKKNVKKREIKISAYEVNSDHPGLICREDNKLLKTIVHTGEDDELDPRAEGTLKHRILQMINSEDDLNRAMLEMRVSGLISKAQLDDWTLQLRQAIKRVEDRGWFSDERRVYSERPIITGKDKDPYRPDRVVVDSENNAEIIDYKFGEKHNSHFRQVKNYMDLLRDTHQFASVKGYLWYIPENKIEEVN